MKKSALIVLALVIVTVLLTSCTASFPTKERVAVQTSEEATKLLKNKTAKEIRNNWGEPERTFFSFYGDKYVCNGKSIVIYYDADDKVTDVLVDEILI